jgi:hypothetical protein
MAEFTFPCPQCKQRIQCDASYVGSQINCPLCQKAVIVPPIPPPTAAGTGERVIQIKTSTLRAVAMLGASVLLAGGILALTIHLLAGPKTVTFKAFVDGVDVVKLSGKNLWIEHLYDQLPSRMSINGKKWNPVWDKNTSANYELNPAFKPSNADSVKLTKRTGRGAINIMEEPTPGNDETLVIRVDDGGIGGADWYEFTVSW